MAWTDQTALENAITESLLIDLTADTDNPSAVDTTKLNACIASADAYIKGKLKHRYPSQVSAETASADISEISLCLTIRNLYGRRVSFELPRGWMDRIDRALNDLDAIARGDRDVISWNAGDSIQ